MFLPDTAITTIIKICKFKLVLQDYNYLPLDWYLVLTFTLQFY